MKTCLTTPINNSQFTIYRSPLVCPSTGRPLQPNAQGSPPSVPQALNRYAATSAGQVGVAEGASSGLNGVVAASYVVGYAKSLAQEIAAARNLGFFGRDVVEASLRYAGRASIAFEASKTSLNANRGLIKGSGGIFEDSITGIRRTLKSGKLSRVTFRADIFKYKVGLANVDDLASSLRATGNLVQSGFYEARIGVYALDVQPVKTIERVARISKLGGLAIGSVTDAVLGGGFQYLDDLSDPYLSSNQKAVRFGVASVGNAGLGLLGAVIAESLICGPGAPVCAATGSLMGIIVWNVYGQHRAFEFFNAVPERSLKPLNGN